MKFDDMQMRDYSAMLATRHQASLLGMPSMEPWPPDKAARLMAIVQVFGNNEGFTLSPKFNIDRRYIQDLYGIEGGRVPDETFTHCLRKWVSRYEGIKDENTFDFFEAKRWIKKMYNFEIYV